MNVQDPDRRIDAAAREIIAHHPPRSVSRAVMARVLEPPHERPSRPIAWVFVAAAAALCVAVALPRLNKPLQPDPVTTTISKPTTAAPAVSRDVGLQAPSSSRAEARPSVRRSPAAVAAIRPSARPVSIPTASSDTAAFAPFESIVPPPIDVLDLEVHATRIEEIEIQPLVIEPLTASND
jgi:hypothetical protein